MKPFFSSTPQGLRADVFDLTMLEMQNKSSHIELKLVYSERANDRCLHETLKANLLSRIPGETHTHHLSLYEANVFTY